MAPALIAAVCDTLVPAIEHRSPGTVEGEYFARGAEAMDIANMVAEGLDGQAPHVRVAVDRFFARLADGGFTDLPAPERPAALLAAADGDPAARFGFRIVKGMAYGLFCAWADGDGRNPNWEAFGYPGPRSAPPPESDVPRTIAIEEVSGDAARLAADVCIVGSGAGGAVIAAKLAAAGRSVLVLEQGGYHTRADFHELEFRGGAELYLGGGILWSEGGELGLLAGSTLGGGTVINSMVCLRPPPDVRATWAQAGLENADGADFDADIDAVWTELNVNTEATVFNGNTKAMVRGFEALGLPHERLARNVTLADDVEHCGYCNWGCQRGCKRSTLDTYLQTASDHGARCIVRCRAERVTAERGRVTGVDAVVRGGDGALTQLRIDAPTVVLAAGGIESPALLLRSGLGGDQVGKHLCVHPTYMMGAVYDDEILPWHGQIQSAASFAHTRHDDGGSFLLESLTMHPGLWGAQAPWLDGPSHKAQLLKLPWTALWHGVSLDHGTGEVVLDDRGEALVRWSLHDERELAAAYRAHEVLARLHAAAGAAEIVPWHFHERRWRRGDDLEAYVADLRSAPADEIPVYSAHQMSSCRMGADPKTSVADPRGQCHEVEGLWIGDASALPTSPGVNPMISIMSLAHRTARHMVAAS